MDTGDTIKCHNCESLVESRLKFCSYCGYQRGKCCSKCGVLLSPNARFCGECGTPIASAPSLKTAIVIKFTCECGKDNSADAKFCQECGKSNPALEKRKNSSGSGERGRSDTEALHKSGESMDVEPMETGPDGSDHAKGHNRASSQKTNFHTLRENVMSHTNDINLDDLQAALAGVEKEKKFESVRTEQQNKPLPMTEGDNSATSQENVSKDHTENSNTQGLVSGAVKHKAVRDDTHKHHGLNQAAVSVDDKTEADQVKNNKLNEEARDDTRIEKELASAMHESPAEEQSPELLSPQKHTESPIKTESAGVNNQDTGDRKQEGTVDSRPDNKLDPGSKTDDVSARTPADPETSEPHRSGDPPLNKGKEPSDKIASTGASAPSESTDKYPTQESGHGSDEDIYGPTDERTADKHTKNTKNDHNSTIRQGSSKDPQASSGSSNDSSGMFGMQRPMTRSQTNCLPSDQKPVFGGATSTQNDKSKKDSKENLNKPQTKNIEDPLRNGDGKRETDIDFVENTQSETNTGRTDNRSYAEAASSEAGYNKFKKQPEVLFEGTKGSLAGSKVNSANQFANKIMDVTFHVVVSRSFKYDENRHKIFLRTDKQELGGWNSDKIELRYETKIDDRFILMRTELSMPKEWFVSGRGFEYKYILRDTDKNEKPYVWEELHGTDDNRLLTFRDKTLANCDVWHQYDGVMCMKSDKSYLRKTFDKGVAFVKGETKITYEMEEREAVLAMLPDLLSTDKIAGSVLLEKIFDACLCLEKHWRRTSGKYTEATKTFRSEILLEHITTLLERLSKIKRNTTESDEEASQRIACAMVVVCICVKYDLAFACKEITHPLFTALRIRPLTKEECPEFSKLTEYHFANDSKMLAENLTKLINSMCHHYRNPVFVDLRCLKAFPLLHFLAGASRPAEQKKTDIDHYYAPWWGIDGLDTAVDQMKKQLRSNNTILARIYDDLAPLFPADFLLQRSLVAVLNWEHVQQISSTASVDVAVITACIWYHIHSNNLRHEQLKALEDIIPHLIKRNEIEEDILMSKSDIGEAVQEAKTDCEIALHFLELLCQRAIYITQKTIVIAAVQLIANMLSTFERIIVKHISVNGNETENVLRHELDGRWNRTMQYLKNWFSRFLKVELLSPLFSSDYSHRFLVFSQIEELPILSSILQIQTGTSERTSWWCDSFMSDLKRKITRHTEQDQIEAFCMVNPGVYHQRLDDCFAAVALEVVENVQKGGLRKCDFIFDHMNAGRASRFSELLSKLFEKEWPRPETQFEVIKHALSWPTYKLYLKVYGDVSKKEFFNLMCRDKINLSVTHFFETVTQLKEGNISNKLFQLIREHSEALIEICKIVNENCVFELRQVIQVRAIEFDAYLDRRRKLEVFTQYCSELSLQSDEMDRLQECLKRDVFSGKHCEICRPIPLQKMLQEVFKAEPVIIAFDISDDVYRACPLLEALKESMLFRDLWNTYGERAKMKGTVSFDSVVRDMFQPSMERLELFWNKMKNGTIILEEIDNVLKPFHNRPKELEQELKIICRGRGHTWVSQRVRQIEEYYQLITCKRGARIFMDIRNGFGLGGDFSILTILVNAGEDKSQPLKSITNYVIRAGEDVANIGEREADCIQAFHECSQLVAWLHDSVKEAKEIKTLVDLAMMSAQYQGSMEVEKVLMLDAAVTGYAPLIYHLGAEAGFVELLDQCKIVWRALAADDKLPKKLRDTALHIQWLKDVKESHGSVEVNAMTQVTNINARGVYRVGCIENNGSKGVSNVIKLFIVQDIEETQEKQYSYDKLCDLQSKLMLVAGKSDETVLGTQKQHGTENVERFVEILDGVTRLAKVYTELCTAGCILFKHWNATFFCDPNRKIHTQIDFGGKSERIIIEGLKAKTHEVSDEIKRVCESMEGCLNYWTHHITVQREQCYFLNNYTTEQLVILCTEIAKFWRNPDDFSHRIYHMLDRVKCGCTNKDLKKAIQDAFRDLQASSPVEKKEVVESESETQSKDNTAVETFIKEMMESGYSKALAKEALLTLDDPTDTNEGILWCLEHQDEPPTEPRKDSDSEASDSDKDEYGDIMQSETLDQLKQFLLKDASDDQSKTLKAKLEEIWDLYIKSSRSTSVSDFLSIEHLGYILQCLAETDTSGDIQRSLPSSCKKGQANLIVCPENEVFRLCLSIYMEEEGRGLPLPTETEILLCTHNTRAEEVELLLHRAFGMERGGRLYCLVNADRLEYDVGVQVEKFYEHMHKRFQDIQLVIICAKEREDKSTIVTAFERCRVSNPILQDVTHIQAYIKDKLCVTGATRPQSIAQLDPDRCSVRVVKSHRAGVGKSLKASRLSGLAQQMNARRDWESYVRVNMHRRHLHVSDILQQLLQYTRDPNNPEPRLFHLDIAHEVLEGVDDFLFNLVVLGSLTDHEGYVWRRSKHDLYIIEAMPIILGDRQNENNVQNALRQETVRYAHPVFQFLPSLTCWSPTESREILTRTNGIAAAAITYRGYQQHDQLMDEEEFGSQQWQRVFQYLQQFDEEAEFDVDASTVQGNMQHCLEVLLRHCGLLDPSWAELRHFVWFLNLQLLDCDESVFCGPILAQDLPGFKRFVVRCMIQMSRDFATRSLTISEETPSHATLLEEEVEVDIAQYQLKRRWESSPHPYVFFNADGNSMTFLGFNIGRHGEMIDHQTGQVLEENMMPRQLQQALHRNLVPLNENFDALHRYAKIDKIHRIMGINEDEASYPDESYVLTTDNVKKIMAIYMRFRCGIPVIIMGETGCGKTRLIKFMCDLQKPPTQPNIENMILMKIHGGTTAEDVERKLRHAIAVAKRNKRQHKQVDTVLFFDEANTTEEIGKIKRIMVDNDAAIHQSELRIVAACNPYRKHSEEMIKRLEQAGLGYHIQADETVDKLGQVPMRRLVYRVQALPQSMLPLVWDFGQLDLHTETQYIQEMINKCIQTGDDDTTGLPGHPLLQQTLSNILAASQDFMRQQKDECSFVSLRDVERVLRVMCWFYQHNHRIFAAMDNLARQKRANQKRKGVVVRNGSDAESEEEDDYSPPDGVTRALILALGVCYHACLDKRDEYRQHVARLFTPPLNPVDADTIGQEIDMCQDVFLNEITLEENIAKNQALKENVFMMIVCIELRIPLFLVGKPGSSKSLAKTIVADAMQGDASRSDLFKDLKSVRMVSYQCSPLATPQGIVGTFKQCADLQKSKDLAKFVSVVVLDEVGLAEDSPRMPLKALHPLLEDGCEGDETPKPYMKVAFIGISNWALDPAKMNRGILVQRGVPDEKELKTSAEGICTDPIVKRRIMPLVPKMAKAYLELYNSALKIREFFGLRDFYSIIKMVYGFAKRSKKAPTWHELEHSILRNFGGLDGVEPMGVFKERFETDFKDKQKLDTDPDCTSSGLIKACLFGEGVEGIHSESRYLLILTENYAALKILQQELLRVENAQYIFGSSFPKDQEYTQVCRNINRIKICMETGQTVVLMNLENLYESLYDALNQYYVYLGGQRFVDLGLGTHRVKCKVHENFRLIVVAEKEVVYKKFPIPLINRLEKHTLTMETILSEAQQQMARDLHHWAEAFLPDTSTVPGVSRRKEKGTQLGDVFIGYEKDTAASVVLQVSNERSGRADAAGIDVLDTCKHVLLQCATPESVWKLNETRLRIEQTEIQEIYDKQQKHDSIQQFMEHFVVQQKDRDTFAQVTTHSKLLSGTEVRKVGKRLGLTPENIQVESLQAFDTEQQFCKQIKHFYQKPAVDTPVSLLLLQCDSGNEHGTLIASARYSITDAYRNEFVGTEAYESCRKHVVFLIQLPRKKGGCFTGFEGGQWISYHVDELLPETGHIPSVHALRDKSVSTIFQENSVIDDKLSKEMELMSLNSPSMMGFERVGHDDVMETNDSDAEIPMHPESPDTVVNDDYQSLLSITDRLAHSEAQPKEKGGDISLDDLIKSCLHGAAAMLEDETAQSQRKTERVRIVMKLFDQKPGEGRLTFIHVVRWRLTMLLREKESAVSGRLANCWLANEAASIDAILEAGTFRQSVWQHFKTKVTPLLAGILAYCDSNQNLDLVYNAPPADWIHRVWLALLWSSAATRFSYTDLMSANRELDRIQVRGHGPQGCQFNTQLPFSWIIKNKLDQLVHQARQDHTNEDPVQTVKNLFDECAEAKTVYSEVGEEHVEQYRTLYRHDFLRMVFKCHSEQSEQEYQLVENTMVRLATSSERALTETALHFQYADIQSRLELFGEAVQLCPQIVAGIMEKNENDNIFNTTQEMTLDVQALLFILERLTPREDMFKEEEARAAWMEHVEHFRLFIERMLDIGLHPPIDIYPFGELCVRTLNQCRCMWNRICALQLYIGRVCAEITEDNKKFTVDLCFQLWKLLGDSADFKTEKTFTSVERFLKLCTKKSFTNYFGEGKRCATCEAPVEAIVKMPCKAKHEVCVNCIQQYAMMEMRQCPSCREDYPKSFKPKPQGSNDGKKFEAYKRYKQRCNSFFIEIVSRLCFAGENPPSDSVVEKLLGYITKDPGFETKDEGRLLSKELTVHKNDTIDPTPAVRSFLLQLLLRSNMDGVKKHLNNFFLKAERVLGKDNKHILQLCLLFMNCIEDSIFGQYQRMPNNTEALRFAHNLFRRSNLWDAADSIEKLEAIAQVRMGLSVAAEWMHRLHCTKEPVRDCMREVRRLADAAATVCDQPRLKWPRLHLIRLINKRYGTDVLKSLSEEKYLNWILPEETRAKPGQKMVPTDRFLVYGTDYATLKAALKIAIFSGEYDPVLELLSKIHTKAPTRKETSLLLALHREITVFLIENRRETLPQEKQQQLMDFLARVDGMKQIQLAQCIVLRNTELFRGSLTSARNAMLTELLLHFLVLLSFQEKGNKWLLPFIQLLSNPQAMRDAYLPTMPQDHFMEVLRATEAERRRTNENLVIYQCPNGHPYVIGNCGRPYATATCKGCGATIGGNRHQAATGNTVVKDRADQTATGHILGSPNARSTIPVPERNLSPVSTCILRMLTHIAMYLGACENPAHAASLVMPRIHDNQVSRFVMEHICCDLDVFAKAMNKSPDDCCLLMHILLANILHVNQDGRLDASLSDQRSRAQWETRFCDAVLHPCLNAMDARLSEQQRAMVEDSKIDANPLLKILYEAEPALEDLDLHSIQHSPFMWRFRSRITVDNLAQTLTENMSPDVRERCSVLRHFIQQEPLLRALRFVPDILRLQKLLIRRFNNSIDGAEATTMMVSEYVRKLEGPTLQEFMRLIDSFQQAWMLVKKEFATFVCGNKPIPAGYQNIDVMNLKQMSLAMLLPSWRGCGICSVAVLNLLCSLQNDFLEKYGQLTEKSVSRGVSIRECTLANLVAYHPERDLLPLVMATRNYTLLQGRDTQAQHDLIALQRQIEERFIRGKTRIEPDVETITFREDLTNAKVFKYLRSRIQQVALGSTLAQQIAGEYRDLNDINRSLSLLDIAIGYLVSVDREPETLLKDFMKNQLTLKASLHSEQARRSCRLEHVQSLWLLLSHLKAKHLHDLGHDAFDNVEESYKEDLTGEMKTQLHAALCHTTISTFMAELHECIVLHITAKRSQEESADEEDDAPNHNYPLGYSMHAYIEGKEGTDIPVISDPIFPVDILFKHCTAAWREAYNFKKQSNRP